MNFNDNFFIQKVENAKDLNLPKYMTSGSAGLDLCANIEEDVLIEPSEYKVINTGIKISIPSNCEAQLRPRSGLALKYGITLLNSPGTIDSDYRGEIKVILINHGKDPFIIKRGDRIAQMVISQILNVQFEETYDLDNTIRGDKGFGHTGVSI